VIQQFVTLGKYFMQRNGVGTVGGDAAQYAQDPSKKFLSKTVYLLIFSDGKFKHVQVEEYSEDRRGWYLYRQGPPNGFDATPTTGFPVWKTEDEFFPNLEKRLKRLGGAIKAALVSADEATHSEECSVLRETAEHFESAVPEILNELKLKRHEDSKQQATLSLAWQETRHGHQGESPAKLKRVGDFEIFRGALVKSATAGFAGKKTQGTSSGRGQCSICGATETDLLGGLQIPNFRFYTLDKRGAVSGGFDPIQAWRNFPACPTCCEAADYAGERVKAELAFSFYGFKYLILPLAAVEKETDTFRVLKRLTDARMSKNAIQRLTDAEDEIIYVLSEEENVLQVDLLFYQPDPKYFRPMLYVSGMLPSHFRKLFDAKDKVNRHPWFSPPSPRRFVDGDFTFRSLRRILPDAHGGSTFDDDFFEAVRAALQLRAFPPERLLALGMRWVRQGFGEACRVDEALFADLVRTLLFFEMLTGGTSEIQGENMNAGIYGGSPQAERVRTFFSQANGALQANPAAQAAFLVGACCKRIMDIQDRVRGSRPFLGKLKGLRLKEEDIKRLLPEAVDKAEAYGDDNKQIVAGLLECAAAAMAAAGDRWKLSGDEVSYYFALGLVLAPRLAAARGSDT